MNEQKHLSTFGRRTTNFVMYTERRTFQFLILHLVLANFCMLFFFLHNIIMTKCTVRAKKKQLNIRDLHGVMLSDINNAHLLHHHATS